MPTIRSLKRWRGECLSLSEYGQTLGEAKAWDDAVWPEFHRCVLRLVVEALDALDACTTAEPTWTETQLTTSLYLCMNQRLEATVPRLQIVVRLEHQLVDAAGVLSGRVDPTTSPRVEIVVQQVSMPLRTYLACECKVITTKTIGHRRPKATIDAYVQEGLRRFVDGAYSSTVNLGIMIGFVVWGATSTIARRITDAIIREKLPATVSLTPSDAAACAAHYYSRHPRVTGPLIQVEHLFWEIGARKSALEPQTDQSPGR